MAGGLLALGELGMAREIAEIFRREAENAGRMTETVVGLRYLGLTCNLQGELREAEANLVRALELYNPERDREANLRYGVDTRAGALSYLAGTKWGLGEIAQVRGLSEEAIAHARGTGHVPTIIGVYQSKAVLESAVWRRRCDWRTAETVLELGQQHKLAVYVAWGQIFAGWAREKLGEREAGTAQLQRGLMALTELGTKGGAVYPQGLLAEIEAQGQQVEGALARIDEALALAQQTGEHWSDAFLHRVRGEILLKRDPANTAPAEDAFLTAIAIARQQKARSFELLAALALANLYESANRAAEAYAVLAPALDGFAPISELPRDRGGASAPNRAGRDRRSESRCRGTRATGQTADRLRIGGSVVQGICVLRKRKPPSHALANLAQVPTTPTSDLPPFTGFGSVTSRAASWRWRGRLPRYSGAKRRTRRV